MKKTTGRMLLTCAAAMAVASALLGGCAGSGGDQVTVKPPPIRAESGKIELEQIIRLEDAYGFAWLSDSEIISTKKPKWMEAPLYVHSLVREKDPEKTLGVQEALTVNPSPEGKVLFVSNQMKASFLRMEDLKKIPLDVSNGNGSILNGNVRGAWLEEKAYLFASADGLVVADLDGNAASVLKFKDGQAPVKVEAAVDPKDPKRFTAYFIDEERKVYSLKIVIEDSRFPKAEGSPELLETNAADFSVSPDGTRLAVAKETGENANRLELVKTGETGTGTTLIEGRLIRQISWSPDGSKLAYSLFNLERGGSGLYVMNTKTGHTTLVSLYPNLQSLLIWSPDGNQLMMSQENPEMNLTTERTKLMTEIYRFK
ncbi:MULTISPECIES: PD40 domain-containing protein [Paenibacillus]|uniref:Uncharacterized protein n=1 Tax=Paenibacillus albilobatus TaxID=2716884 RepID=A0A919XB30_9BACL|nr:MULTISPECIES: PD40 domain-containing protein [Paenibacillus]GIO29357.1 hypothetical protein J2TS6_04980 [Paenibacillus albilobatus]